MSESQAKLSTVTTNALVHSVGHFFCDQGVQDKCDPRRMVGTFAYQLAQNVPGYREALSKLASDSNLDKRTVNSELLIDLIPKLFGDLLNRMWFRLRHR